MGWPVGIEYSQSSAIDNAHRLEGKLLLIVGEMDRNVDPSATFQLADRLIKAGKYFDMLYVPGASWSSRPLCAAQALAFLRPQHSRASTAELERQLNRAAEEQVRP